jgi:hypothetical protein
MEIVKDKKLYASYIQQYNQLPIFNQPFWLDAVCGKDNWNVILIIDNKQIVAALPYFVKKKYMFEIITMPKHTQRFSPCLKYSDKLKTYNHKIDFENKIMAMLLSALPSKIYSQISLHFDYNNILPLLWSGYKLKYRHTYVIDNITSIDEVFYRFSKNRKRSVRKAKKNVFIKDDLDAEKFYSFHQRSLEKKSNKISYSINHFEKIYNACRINKCGKTFYAIDKDKNMHAALFIIWDKQAAYHLIPVVNPDFYKSQSISLLVYHAIEFLKDKTKTYDFEGSMMMNVEKAYREYGALPKSYFNISTSKFRLSKILFC